MGRQITAGATAPIGSFGAGAVQHLLEAFGGMGVDADLLQRDAGIDSARRRGPGDRIEAALLLILFALAAERTGDPLVGLHAAERVRFGGLGSYLLGAQNTVADALRMQDRFQALLLGATAVSIRQCGQMTAVTLDAGSPPRDVRHLTEYCIASSCRLMRWLTVHAAVPDEIHFRHGPAGAVAEYERIVACPVRFNMRENGALLSRAKLTEPLLSANAELAARLELAARTEIAAPAVAAFRDAVVRALRSGPMDRAGCRRDVVARRLGVSARTLQRRLGDEGTSFGAILDETRRHTATELIADPSLSVGEVGKGVGYADQFAFNKAFRRWTGRSPSAYRREILSRAPR